AGEGQGEARRQDTGRARGRPRRGSAAGDVRAAAGRITRGKALPRRRGGMTTVVIVCSECGKQLKVAEIVLDKKLKCPGGAAQCVAEEAKAGPAASGKSPSKPAASKAPRGGEDEDEDERLPARTSKQRPAQKEKKGKRETTGGKSGPLIIGLC